LALPIEIPGRRRLFQGDSLSDRDIFLSHAKRGDNSNNIPAAALVEMDSHQQSRLDTVDGSHSAESDIVNNDIALTYQRHLDAASDYAASLRNNSLWKNMTANGICNSITAAGATCNCGYTDGEFACDVTVTAVSVYQPSRRMQRANAENYNTNSAENTNTNSAENTNTNSDSVNNNDNRLLADATFFDTVYVMVTLKTLISEMIRNSIPDHHIGV
jgi:hypothetical protein